MSTTAIRQPARKKTHVKRGDEVVVISGNHKGDSGKVIRVLPKKDQVIVEGVRMITKHSGKTKEHPEGGRIQREGPIHISNVKLVEHVAADEKKVGKIKKEA